MSIGSQGGSALASLKRGALALALQLQHSPYSAFPTWICLIYSACLPLQELSNDLFFVSEFLFFALFIPFAAVRMLMAIL